MGLNPKSDVAAPPPREQPRHRQTCKQRERDDERELERTHVPTGRPAPERSHSCDRDMREVSEDSLDAGRRLAAQQPPRTAVEQPAKNRKSSDQGQQAEQSPEQEAQHLAA
jgi:hypothetical protein